MWNSLNSWFFSAFTLMWYSWFVFFNTALVLWILKNSCAHCLLESAEKELIACVSLCLFVYKFLSILVFSGNCQHSFVHRHEDQIESFFSSFGFASTLHYIIGISIGIVIIVTWKEVHYGEGSTKKTDETIGDKYFEFSGFQSYGKADDEYCKGELKENSSKRLQSDTKLAGDIRLSMKLHDPFMLKRA